MNSSFDTPVALFHGVNDPEQPLVVLLHGRGSHEGEIISLAPLLAPGATYAAVRAPIAEGGGYAWFANRGIGRPVAESLAATMAWFRGWLDEVAPNGRPVILLGFSGGAAFAGGLVLADPARYFGAAILYGTLPFDAGVPTTPSRLSLLPMFVAQGDADRVIPADLLERTWNYLHAESGAPTQGYRDAGGHGITQGALQHLASWVHARLNYVQAHQRPATVRSDVEWPSVPGGRLPDRVGERPAVSWKIPQQQLADNSPAQLQEQLFARISSLPGVSSGESRISVPGARSLVLAETSGPTDAFLVSEVGEFAHLHPAYDGSLHVALPPAQAADLVAHGWGTPHMWAGSYLPLGFTMVFGPRDEEELEIVAGIVAASHAWASGTVLSGV